MSRASGYARAEDDWYVEPGWTVDGLIRVESFSRFSVDDPACGAGTIPTRFKAAGIAAIGSDLVDRGWKMALAPRDFLAESFDMHGFAMVSNPPYSLAEAFVRRALDQGAGKVCILARLAFLESTRRTEFFASCGLARVWVSRRRISMPPGGVDVKAKGGSIAYAWFVFQPGHVGPWSGGWF